MVRQRSAKPLFVGSIPTAASNIAGKRVVKLLRSRKKRDESGPLLPDRVLDSGCRRVGILGLHPGAGARTVLASLVRQFHRRQRPYGVTSFPRPPLEDEPEFEPFTRIALPEGANLVGAASLPARGAAALQLIESTRFDSPLGEVGLYRVVEGGEVELCGPDQPEEMGAALSRLAEVTGGIALVDGGWERRGFAAPGVTDGVVLAVGAGFSATPERSAAAVRYLAETFDLPACTAELRRAWHRASEASGPMMLDLAGNILGLVPGVVDDPLSLLRAASDAGMATIVIPGVLGDDLLAPLVRVGSTASIVVRDPTRITASPVYVKAWQKAGGDIQVVQNARVIALAVNPVNRFAGDADPGTFLRLVAEAVPGLPAHDVAREADEPARRPVWRFWE